MLQGISSCCTAYAAFPLAASPDTPPQAHPSSISPGALAALKLEHGADGVVELVGIALGQAGNATSLDLDGERQLIGCLERRRLLSCRTRAALCHCLACPSLFNSTAHGSIGSASADSGKQRATESFRGNTMGRGGGWI